WPRARDRRSPGGRRPPRPCAATAAWQSWRPSPRPRGPRAPAGAFRGVAGSPCFLRSLSSFAGARERQQLLVRGLQAFREAAQVGNRGPAGDEAVVQRAVVADDRDVEREAV